MEQGYFSTVSGGRMGYLLYAPETEQAEKRPMIVYLHGMDGCGDDPAKILAIKSLPSFLLDGSLPYDGKTVFLAPQCPVGSRWDPFADDVAALIDDVSARCNVDPDRVALTGASLGGMGTFTIAFRHPERFSCLVPVCASVDPARCTALTGMPVHIFHGSEDVDMGFSVVEADEVIRRAGGQSRLTMLPGEGHEIRWIYTAPEFAIVRWMTEQRRTK